MMEARDQSESQVEIAKALNLAQSAMQSAKRSQQNDFVGKPYADLSDVWDAIRKPFAENGLSITQEPTTVIHDGSVVAVEVRSTLLHVSGEFRSSTLRMPIEKRSAQGIGSAITYARRYALSAIAGVATDDDDGNAASHTGNESRSSSKTRQASSKAKTPKNKPANSDERNAARADAQKAMKLYRAFVREPGREPGDWKAEWERELGRADFEENAPTTEEYRKIEKLYRRLLAAEQATDT